MEFPHGLLEFCTQPYRSELARSGGYMANLAYRPRKKRPPDGGLFPAKDTR